MTDEAQDRLAIQAVVAGLAEGGARGMGGRGAATLPRMPISQRGLGATSRGEMPSRHPISRSSIRSTRIPKRISKYAPCDSCARTWPWFTFMEALSAKAKNYRLSRTWFQWQFSRRRARAGDSPYSKTRRTV